MGILLCVSDAIGWISSLILLLTVAKQVHTQWVTGASEGISFWLFFGQVAASAGFLVYSWLLGNWIFVCTNSLMLMNSFVGYWVLYRNKKWNEVKHANKENSGKSSQGKEGRESSLHAGR